MSSSTLERHLGSSVFSNLFGGHFHSPSVATRMRAAHHPLSSYHAHLLAFDLLSLQQAPHPPNTLMRLGRPLFRVEILGLVVSVDRKENFLRFVVDDGTGCVPCILWLNFSSPRFARVNPIDLEVRSEIAYEEAAKVKLGRLVRVQGRITSFNKQIQVTVSSLQLEINPNAEVLHWVDCSRLAMTCYDPPPPIHPMEV